MPITISPGQAQIGFQERPFFDKSPPIAGRTADGIRSVEQIKRTVRTINANPPHLRMLLLERCKRRASVLRQNGLITPSELRGINCTLLLAISKERLQLSRRQSESNLETKDTTISMLSGSPTEEPPSSTQWETGAEPSSTS